MSECRRLRHSLDTLARAWKAIAFFLGEEEDAPSDLDVALLARLARVHGLEAALADPGLATRSPRELVPDEVWQAWQRQHAGSLAATLLRDAPLRRALDVLAPLPVVLLKGAVFSELLYPSPAARPMADVDLLVRPRDLGSALERLEGLGFRRIYRGDAVLDHAGTHALQLESPELGIDLHQGFTQAARLPIPYAEVVERSIPWPRYESKARLLSPEDLILHAFVNPALGELKPSSAPALTLLDLRQILLGRGTLWEALGRAPDAALVGRRAREWGVERMLYATGQCVGRIFPSVATRARAFTPALPGSLRRLLDAAVVRRASPPRLRDPPRPLVLVRKALLLRPSSAAALARYYAPRAAERWLRRHHPPR